jgi:hypothetical protein
MVGRRVIEVRGSEAVVAEIDRAEDGQDVSEGPKFRLFPVQLFDWDLHHPALATHSSVRLYI